MFVLGKAHVRSIPSLLLPFRVATIVILIDGDDDDDDDDDDNDDGFFLACEHFGGRFDCSFPDYAFKRRSARAHQFHFFLSFLCQDQSTVAQQAETTAAVFSLASCV